MKTCVHCENQMHLSSYRGTLLVSSSSWWTISSEICSTETSMHLFCHKMVSSSSSGKSWNERISWITCPKVETTESERERAHDPVGPPGQGSEEKFSTRRLAPATWEIHTQSCRPSPIVPTIYQATALKCKNYPRFRALVRTPFWLVTLPSQETGSTAQMVAWSLVFVFCPPQLAMLAAREQAKIKPPTMMLHKSRRRFLTALCPLNPQRR